jgi:endothelin-converting enzyme
MSSPSSSVKPPKRPEHGSRHGSSWINRIHRQHDRKHHSEEQEPLLADDQPESDVEAQETLQQPQSRRRGCWSAIKQWFDKVATAFKRFSNAISRNWKQILIACVLTLLTVLISLLIGFYFHHKGHDNVSISVCTSAACVHAASGILYNLDPAYAQIARFEDPSKTASKGYFNPIAKDLSSDACTDFNKLVCGGFDQHHDLRPDQSDMFTGTLMVEDSQTILRHILEGDASKISSEDRPNFEKLKADYDACMDESTIKDQRLDPLMKVTDHIKELFGTSEETWKTSPVRSSHRQQGIAYTSTNELTNALLYMEELEISGLFSAGIGVSFALTKR